MARLNANPNAEASVSFDVVAPGVYRMRVESISDFTAKSGNTCWKLRASFVPTGSINKLDGSPANNPGSIFDNGLVVAPADKQGKVRSFVEACGKQWGDLDSEDLIGLEFDAKIGLEDDQNGEKRNNIKYYLAPKN